MVVVVRDRYALLVAFVWYSIGYGVPLQADIAVSAMMTKLQEQYPERRNELIELLGTELTRDFAYA